MTQIRALLPALLAGALCAAAYADAPSGSAHYQLDAAKSTLEFAFEQAGAQNKGHFRRFTVDFEYAAASSAPSRLEVTVDMNSLDSGDGERDDTLKSAELFDVKKFPQAHFLATQFSKTASGYEALGKLTIRNVTRDARVPFTFRSAAEGGATVGYLSGKTQLQRLDYGVGQGDWKATDQVGNEVGVAFALRLTAH
jgi:polyisoprenoid-binding protein YceI